MYDLPFFSTGGGSAENGKDGVSPTITVEDITGGHRLTIVDAKGTRTVDIMDGSAGKDGSKGKDGVNAIITNATASVDNTSGTPKVSVSLGGTESERTFAFSFTGLKGAKGDTGTQGIQGEQGLQGEQGPQGDPGPTGTSIAISSVSESAEDGGNNVITFSDGKTITIKNGTKGSEGPAYVLTEADKAEIVAAVVAELNTQT
jgi:hypothetical protein